MVDDENHKTSSKRDRKDYMRDYMRERRKRVRQQPAPTAPELHGPPAPPNLPRTDSPKAILQAHLNHVLTLWAETCMELARLKDADEMLQVIDSMSLEIKNLQAENKTLREASRTCQVEPPEPQEPPKPQEPGKTCNPQPSTEPPETCNPQPSTEPPETCNLQPSESQEPPKREVEPGFVDPDRRPTSAADPEASWMG